MSQIRVFLLDDHEIVRRGLADLISLQSDLEVVGEAGTAAEALIRITAAQPDVAVLDVRLPDGNGVEVCREIRSLFPHIHVLMLTSYADDEALFTRSWQELRVMSSKRSEALTSFLRFVRWPQETAFWIRA